MWYAVVNNRTEIKGKTFSLLKRAATIAANAAYNSIDTMVVWNDIDGVLTGRDKGMSFSRINRKSPDNRIIRGRWN